MPVRAYNLATVDKIVLPVVVVAEGPCAPKSPREKAVGNEKLRARSRFRRAAGRCPVCVDFARADLAADADTNLSPRYGLWGETLATALDATNLPQARVGEDTTIAAFHLQCTVGEAIPTELCRRRVAVFGNTAVVGPSCRGKSLRKRKRRSGRRCSTFRYRKATAAPPPPYLHCRRRGNGAT
jgi:hypothetical protein